MSEHKGYLKYFKNINDFKQLVEKSFEFVSTSLNNAPSSHSFHHTLRVTSLSLELAKKLNAAIDVLIIAAIFHDVARSYENETGNCHAKKGAEIAEKFLLENQMDNLVEDVTTIILSHRYSKGIKPNTLEGKILQDADMLDALGSIGLFRVISFSVENKRNIKETNNHFTDKLFHLPSRMHFSITKKLAKERVKILHKYYEEIETEIERSKIESIMRSIKLP